MRKPIIAGNWKMNLLPAEGVDLVLALWERIKGQDRVEAVVCPPFVDLVAVSDAIRSFSMDLGLGAQNMHWEDKGAFTGEVSPPMLLDLGVQYVIIGHSERRQFLGETDQGVNRKVRSAFEHGLVPIMCVGESLKQRETGEASNIVSDQVKRGLFEIEAKHIPGLVVAYEPIWAIGTGKAATSDDAQSMNALVRETVEGLYGKDAAEAVRVQYGGSVNPKNVSELMAMPDIDGALVGGASLKPDDFSALVRYS